LGRVIATFGLPVPLLDDLLSAFEQDVIKTRDGAGYADRAALLDYCTRSANPVGRLLLHLYGVREAEALAQSDAICSALQLINFWQDLSVDIPRGRFYLPQDRCAALGVDPGNLEQTLYVQQKAAASGSSFYYAFLFLPAQRRAAITAFYAFCREVDDVVDEVTDPGVARTKLAWWQAEVAKAFAGQPTHPVMQALMPHCADYGIEQRHLQAVIEGCQMDLEQTRYLDFAGLKGYCHLVAGMVGEVSARIFGQTDPRTTAYAHRLGLAFQLTNIIRDVGEDAMRGRIYLPVSELQQFDVKAHEILKRSIPSASPP
jgi:squalene synthase HpnD